MTVPDIIDVPAELTVFTLPIAPDPFVPVASTGVKAMTQAEICGFALEVKVITSEVRSVVAYAL
jgi:hypothetical protein